jgi:3-oxoacyl-[acyl-carrier protein] reductase
MSRGCYSEEMQNTTEKDRPFADLTGRTALVTGASSGIGRAIAEELARGGADVIVHYARSEQVARETLERVTGFGRRGELLQADLRELRACPHSPSPLKGEGRGEGDGTTGAGSPTTTSGQALDRTTATPATGADSGSEGHPEDYDALTDRAWSVFGRVDIWVNNAGADLLTGEDSRLDYAEKLRRLFEVDVEGTVHLSREAIRRMKRQGSGVVLNIGWDQADRGMDGESAELFSTAKNAIMGFTRSLAVNAAPQVRVNCIAPGWIRTAWGEQAGETWQQRVLAETPLRRWGLPEDVARLARFLASDEAAYITGQVINANGGAVR